MSSFLNSSKFMAPAGDEPNLSSSETATPRSDPLAFGSTTLPKIPLSYRWDITDVETFIDKTSLLCSPSICTTLPLSSHNQAYWRLTLEKKFNLLDAVNWSAGKELHVCLQQDCTDHTAKGSRAGAPQLKPTTGKPSSAQQAPTPSRVLVSGCNFFILNPKTNKAVFTATAPNMECEIGGKQNGGYIRLQSVRVHCSDLPKLVHNNVLVIQVDATILCYTNPCQKSQLHSKRKFEPL